MAGFLGRWMSDALRLGLSLAVALAAMQLPALAREYATALLQVTDDARRDIDQREASARQFYPAAGDTDDAVIAFLRPVEPSNAQALQASLDRTRALRAAYDRIEAASPLLRPIVAAVDVVQSPGDDKHAVLWTAVDTYAPQVLLGTAAVIYGLVGLALGAFVAEALVSMGRALGGPRVYRGRLAGSKF